MVLIFWAEQFEKNAAQQILFQAETRKTWEKSVSLGLLCRQQKLWNKKKVKEILNKVQTPRRLSKVDGDKPSKQKDAVDIISD